LGEEFGWDRGEKSIAANEIKNVARKVSISILKDLKELFN